MNLPLVIKKGKNNSRKNLLKAIVFILAIVFLWWFISNTDICFEEFLFHLKVFNWKFIYLLGVTFIAYLLATLAWQFCFYTTPQKTNLIHLFNIRLIGESLAQINPTSIIAGESLKAYILKKRGINYKDSLVSIAVSRFLMLFTGILLVIAGLFLFIDKLDFINSKLAVFMLIGIAALVFTFLIIALQKKMGIFYYPIGLLFNLSKHSKLKRKFLKLAINLRKIDRDLITIYHKKQFNLFLAFVLTLLHWIAGAMEYYVILKILNIQISVFSCITIEVGVMVFKALSSYIPGQVGVEEYANKLMLSAVGVNETAKIWLIVALMRRVRQIIWIGIGFILFGIIMKKIKNGNPVY